MKRGEGTRIEGLLKGLPIGKVTVVSHCPSGQGRVLLTDQFTAQTDGTGKVELYDVFPGIEASYYLFLAQEVTLRHRAAPRVMEVFYCRSGRVGWNMRGGTAVYLGSGDLVAHSAACCAQSDMMFPLGYGEGLSISVDFSVLEGQCPEILGQSGVNLSEMEAAFCANRSVAIPACPELEEIFAPLYAAPPVRRKAYLQLKVQELMLYLMDVGADRPALTPYGAEQTELVREIHRQLTQRLDRRFTIEELSRQYLINTSSLKEVFKAVYGLPIATYMKEYRIRQAMRMLRETDDAISQIACQVGYETQGKFSKAFKDVTQMLPSEYRRASRLGRTD